MCRTNLWLTYVCTIIYVVSHLLCWPHLNQNNGVAPKRCAIQSATQTHKRERERRERERYIYIERERDIYGEGERERERGRERGRGR